MVDAAIKWSGKAVGKMKKNFWRVVMNSFNTSGNSSIMLNTVKLTQR